MPGLALISDLMMQSHVSGAAARAGVPLKCVSSTEAFVSAVEATRPRLVILDLSHPGLDPAELVPRLTPFLPPGAVTIAFGPHVHHQRLESAAQAGCQLVMSRGQFHAQTEELLKQHAGSAE